MRTSLFVLLLAIVTVGCGKKPSLPSSNTVPGVAISKVVTRTIQDSADFTGRIDSVNMVDIRPRSTGYVTKTPFKEGDVVKKDDLLFEIDKRPYKAKLDDAVGQVKLYEAKLKLAKADNLRAKEVAKTPGAISKQDLDKYVAAEEEAMAAVEAIKASLEVHQLNLEFCRVTSPIDGRISRYYYTFGNLVNADQTLLTTVVSEDPIYAYFDTDERTILRILRLIQAGKVKPVGASGGIQLLVSLADETDYPHPASMNFVNNRIDPLTGTITVRGQLINPIGPTGARLFKPGMFCRVRLPIDAPRTGQLISERAVGTDQGLKFVYVVDAENKAQYRRIELGSTQPDGLRVVESGLQPDDKVVVSGIQLVRPGEAVNPELVEMPVNIPLADTNAKKTKAEAPATISK
jgi:multidrug efflux system membrane fusion protein